MYLLSFKTYYLPRHVHVNVFLQIFLLHRFFCEMFFSVKVTSTTAHVFFILKGKVAFAAGVWGINKARDPLGWDQPCLVDQQGGRMTWTLLTRITLCALHTANWPVWMCVWGQGVGVCSDMFSKWGKEREREGKVWKKIKRLIYKYFVILCVCVRWRWCGLGNRNRPKLWGELPGQPLYNI